MPGFRNGQWVAQVLRREVALHKLQYAKVVKFDASAAVLGVGIGALVLYVGLSSMGSGGAELTDLTGLVLQVLCWGGVIQVAADVAWLWGGRGTN
jgi:hypothetical protein